MVPTYNMGMARITTRVGYFWIPKGAPHERVVEIPEKPVRIQTVLPHRQFDTETGAFIREVNSLDPSVEPIVEHVIHNHTVFCEDELHDWHWQNGVLRYFSRAVHGGVWIRVEWP